MIRSLSFLLITTAFVAAEPFKIEQVTMPPGVDPQIGGLDVLPNGQIATAFHRGEVMFYNPETDKWSLFANGLHEPLGLLAESDSSVVIMQRAELTRIKDTDGDGKADIYETVFDDFGMSGNYHEFAFGPAKGPDGHYYIGLNVASNGAGVRPEIRGEWSDIGLVNFEEMQVGPNYKQARGKAGRMYSRVAYRGWIIRVSPDGKDWEPYACGFRSPDGIGFDADGRLLVDDNQGDWRGTSPLYHVEKDKFYGHPQSLVWKEDWGDEDPRLMPVEKLDAMRTKPAARFPQGDLANSPTAIDVFPKQWGPYANQTIIGEMNQPRMVRFLPDEVGGQLQGALIPMFDGTSLDKGNHRTAFSEDGTMWVGKTHLSWAGGNGLVKITPQDIDSAFTVTSVKLEKQGEGYAFRVGLSQPVADAGKPAIISYNYKYHQGYGSPKIDEATLNIESAKLANDGKELVITTKPNAGSVHQIDLSSLKTKDGKTLEGTPVYYQVNKLP